MLTVITYDREEGKLREFPLRALSLEAQHQAIKMHSLVESDGTSYHFNPRSKMSYSYSKVLEKAKRDGLIEE